METVSDFLDQLATNGVKLSAQAGRLNCYAQKGALTNELKDGIIRFKSELIALLEDGETKRGALAAGSSDGSKEFGLSAGQKGLYILQKLNPGMSAYNVPLCFKINAEIDTDLLAEAWGLVLERFPILTVRFIERDGALFQRPDEGCKTTMQQRFVDFRDDEQLSSFLQKQAKQPFDLNRGPLTRIELFTRDGEKPILLLTVHHIVFDGASAVTVLRSLLEFYQQRYEGRPPGLPRQFPGYQEFVAWEEAMLTSAEGAAHARYWQRRLDGDPPGLEMFPDMPRTATAGFEGRTLVKDLPEKLARWVGVFGSANSLPPSVIFLAAFQLLLHRYTAQDDVIVGMPVIGRPEQRFAEDVGYFINMVPLRAQFAGGVKLTDFLRKTHGAMLDALYHSSYPFPLMLEGLKARRSDNSPLFRISYAYQNFVNPAAFLSLMQQETFQLESVAGIWQEGDFDLGLEIYEGHSSSFSLHVKYNPAVYTCETITGVFEHYCALLEAVSEDSNRFVHEYSILTKHEEQQLLVDFNATRAEYSADEGLHGLFIEQVACHPDNIAVVCGDESLTYRQLDERSHDLALYLQSLGVAPDGLVGLCIGRSLEMVVGLLGILQAGGAYIALDPEDPAERLAYMVRDGGVAIVLTEERLQAGLSVALPADTRLIAINRPGTELEERVAALKSRNAAISKHDDPDQLAYVSYISGTTGPNGVEVTRRSLVNLVRSMRKILGITPRDALLALSSLALDVAALELFLPLSAGARLVVSTHEAASDCAQLLAALRKCGATILHAPSATWRGLLDAGWKGDPRVTMLCGEAMSRSLANRLLETGCPLWNMYGPAETTIWSSAALVESGDGPVPLGRPIDNTKMYILDRHNQPQPPAAPGELHIAGHGVARGYRNRSDLTKEKFVPNPFVPGTLMYGTGDRARRLNDGNLHYLGRTDTQVRIRGFRVELREIEAQLEEHPLVQDSAVIAKGDGEGRLIAFFRTKETGSDRFVKVRSEELRAHLARALPQHMVPALFVGIAEIPLTGAGAVDRAALEDVLEKQQLSYWREKLAGVPERLELPTDFARPFVRSVRKACATFSLDAQDTAQLKTLAERKGATLFVILLAAFKVLLHRYAGENDIVVGTTIACLTADQREDSSETACNSVALRSHVEGEDTFSALLAQVKATCLEAAENRDTPFEKVVAMLRPDVEPAVSPIFQVMAVLRATIPRAADRGLQCDLPTSRISKCDLAAVFSETAAGLLGSIEYSTALYQPPTIARMTEHFIVLCRAIAAKPAARIRDLDCMGEPEKRRMLVDFNDTRTAYPRDRCIHDLFGDQIMANPGTTAVAVGEQQLSYRDLADKSLDLALYLQSLGVKPESVVGSYLERSVDLIVGTVAIARAGGAHLPLDPAESDGRLAYMLQDGQAKIVLTHDKFRYKLTSFLGTNVKLIFLDKQWPEIRTGAGVLRLRGTALREDVQPGNTGYVSYKSTASGKPAGMLIEHRSLVNALHWMQRRHRLNQNDVVLSKRPDGDLSPWEVFWPLAAGASMVLVSPTLPADGDCLKAVVNDSKATTLILAASLLETFLDADGAECSAVKRILSCGAPLHIETVDTYENTFPNASLHSIYAPPEMDCGMIAFDCLPPHHPPVPIGRPIDNMQAYILDRHNRPQPIGIAGELYIAGDGLAKGFLNQPQLTQAKFVANPFVPGSRMYRTGDLARWLDDGNIEHLGRRKREV